VIATTLSCSLPILGGQVHRRFGLWSFLGAAMFDAKKSEAGRHDNKRNWGGDEDHWGNIPYIASTLSGLRPIRWKGIRPAGGDEYGRVMDHDKGKTKNGINRMVKNRNFTYRCF